MKVIFLDIDGVLNSGKPGPRHNENPTQARHVAQLGRILQATGAQVVWSTTWRTTRRQDELDAFVRARGLADFKSVGVTPDLTTRPKMSLFLARPRREEVRAWLDAHPEVTRLVTIDDDTEAEVEPGTHVQCEDIEGGGLSAERADLAIRILGAELERSA